MVWLQRFIIDLYITDINFIYFKTLLYIMCCTCPMYYCIHIQNSLPLFVNPPLLLLVGEQRFGMSTNCFLMH